MKLERRAGRETPMSRKLDEAGPDAHVLKYANGIKLTVKPLAEERGSALIRVLIPGTCCDLILWMGLNLHIY